MSYDSVRELHERKEGLVCLDEGHKQIDPKGASAYTGS